MTRATEIPRWMLVTALVLVASRFAVAAWREAHPVVQRHPVAWRADADAAAREAEESGRPLLVQYSAAWCGPCHDFDERVLRDPSVAEMINEGFVPVRVYQDRDGGMDEQETRLVAEHEVNAWPTTVVLAGEPRAFAGNTSRMAYVDFLRQAKSWHRKALAGR